MSRPTPRPAAKCIASITALIAAAGLGVTALAAIDDAPPTVSTTTPTTAITPPTTVARPAYLIIQDEIDRALAELDAADASDQAFQCRLSDNRHPRTR